MRHLFCKTMTTTSGRSTTHNTMKTTRTVRCSRSAAVAQIFNLLYRGFATRLARGLPQDRATLRRLPAGDTAGSKPALQAMGVRRRPAIPLSRLLAILCLALFVGSVRAADDVTTALQQGLFEEEANQNLDAAIKAYQAVLERHDEQRKLASTALFRLGECYRKLGRTNDAVAQYQRLLRDYSDQTTLVTLSKQNLVGLGIGTVRPLPATGTTPMTAAVSLEAEELARTERILAQLKGWDLGQVRRLIPTLAPDAELEQLEKRFQAAQESAQKAPNDQLRNEALKLLDMTTSRMSDRFDEIVKLLEKRAADLKQVVGKQTSAQAGPLPSPDFNARLKAITDTAATNEEENEVRRIQALIKDSPDLINAGQGFLAETPLLSATRKGQLGVARFLLENKADPNMADSGGIKPLMAAASAGHRAFCELLLQRGANPNAKSDPSQPGSSPAYSRSALHHAAYGGNRAVVEVLLDFKADPNIADQFKGTPLCDAAARGFISVAQLLLERGAKPNHARTGAPGSVPSIQGSGYDAPEYTSGSPLLFAIQRRSLPLAELLLTSQADVNLRRSHDSISPLDLAAQLGDTNLVALLLAAKAGANTSPDSGSTQGWTALHHAVYNVRRDVAELLLKNGANPNARIAVAWPDKRSGESGFTPLLIANYSVQPQLGLLLLDFNADPNLKSSIGNAPLHTALYPVFLNAARSREYITALLDRGAEVQAPNASGFSPLSQATWTGQRELVQLLLDRGADPNQRDMGDDKKGRLLTPLSGLMTITNKDMVAVVEALLQAKADPNLKSELGYTALHRAIMLNQPARTIELLTTHGANVETPDPDGETPLSLAVSAKERKEILQVLLKAGANPNTRGTFGFTALFKAVRRGNLEAIEVLLARKNHSGSNGAAGNASDGL